MFLLAGLLFTGAAAEGIAWVLVVAGLATLIAGTVNTRNNSKPMEYLKAQLFEISNGNYFNWTDITRPDDKYE